MSRNGSLLVIVAAGLMAATRLLAGTLVEQLRCEGWENPLGNDNPYSK